MPTSQDLGRRGPPRTASGVADWLEQGQLERDEEAKKAREGRAVNPQGFSIAGMDPAAPPFYPRKNAGPDSQALGQQANPWMPSAVTEEWLQQAAAAPKPVDALDTKTHGSIHGVPPPSSRTARPFNVIDEFNHWRSNPEMANAVAAVKALCGAIKTSDSTTMMGLEKELKLAAETLKAWDKTSISLSAGCDLFMRYVTRTAGVPTEEFAVGKDRLLERGERFSDISRMARNTIAELGQEFVRDGSVILTHGFSRVVIMLLKAAKANGKNFTVICTEGRPKLVAMKMGKELTAVGIPVKAVLDSGVASVMADVTMVLMGADGVVESGGIINMLGSYQIAIVANGMQKPVYVAAESYKFARLYPLNQKDFPAEEQPLDFLVKFHTPGMTAHNPSRDYTPPRFLTLLFTDLGVLTPSAVSDELIQLYL